MRFVLVNLLNLPDDPRRPSQGYTALMGAAHQGHVEVTKLLVEQRANIEEQNQYGKDLRAMVKVSGKQMDVASESS